MKGKLDKFNGDWILDFKHPKTYKTERVCLDIDNDSLLFPFEGKEVEVEMVELLNIDEEIELYIKVTSIENLCVTFDLNKLVRISTSLS